MIQDILVVVGFPDLQSLCARALVPVFVMTTIELCPQFKALLEKEGVPQPFLDWLVTPDVNVTTVRAFAACAVSKDKVDSDIIAASGVSLNFGQKVRVRLAWEACTDLVHTGQGNGSSAPAAATLSKLPSGTEVMLRREWKARHGFNLSGSWLTSEDTMAKIFAGLSSEPPALFVPDVTAIIRRSNLSQKSKTGTLITAEGVQQVDCTLDPCTTHPEFYLRMRAYLATIAFLSIMKPEFLSFETAIEVSDYIFEAINCRPDGRRPTLACLTACYLSMFGSYAKTLQNEGEKLESWLKNKSKWEYLWKESITSYDSGYSAQSSTGSVEAQGYSIPSDIVAMVRNNETMIKGMQSTIDRGVKAFSSFEPPSPFKKNNGKPNNKGKGGKAGGRGNGKGKADGGNANAKEGGVRKVGKGSAFGAWKKRQRKGN